MRASVLSSKILRKSSNQNVSRRSIALRRISQLCRSWHVERTFLKVVEQNVVEGGRKECSYAFTTSLSAAVKSSLESS